MPRINQPPPTPRIARPQHTHPSPKSRRKHLLLLAGIFALCGLLASAIGYATVSLINGISTTGAPSTVTSDFLAALSSSNYNKAYNDLSAIITIQLTREEFIQQAQNSDRCYGTLTDYTEKPGSATLQGNTQSYIYTITRKKLPHPYELHLTLQQDTNSNWTITSYGNDLGPGQPPCT